MLSIFKFKLMDRVRNRRGDVGTVLGRAVSEEVNRVGERLIYTVEWDGGLTVQIPEEYLVAVYATGYPCREQFYVDEKDVTKECPAAKKLGADALKVTINIEDLPEIKKILAEAALAVSEAHCAQLGRDIEDQAHEVVALRESLRERDKRLHKAEEYTLAVKNNLGFVVSLRCSKGVYDIANMLSDNVEKLREKVAELGKRNDALNKEVKQLTGENAELSGLLNSERDTIRLMLKTQCELVGERDMLRATMEAREKQPPRNAEVERLEAEVTRLATELNRVRGEKE